jgi:hypothetical protein
VQPSIPEGPYILWRRFAEQYWNWRDCKSLKEAVEAEKGHIDWVITKKVGYDIVEHK